MDTTTHRILSLGAGVQSSVLALMMARGETEPADAAIFADTGWEPQGVYDHLDWLEEQLPFPVHRTSIGHNLQDRVRTGHNHSGHKGHLDIPLYNLYPDGRVGFASRRQCTSQYKIFPIRRKIRELIGYPGQAYVPKSLTVYQAFGISTDEFTRMRMSDVKYIENVYPLIEMNMSRKDCLAWWDKHYKGRRLQKSACVGCPFRTYEEWVEVRDEHPEQFQEAVEIDAVIRNASSETVPSFLHKRGVPLAEGVQIDAEWMEKTRHLQDDEDMQLAFPTWDEECTGYCGV